LMGSALRRSWATTFAGPEKDAIDFRNQSIQPSRSTRQLHATFMNR
jgi:hypothetical protein